MRDILKETATAILTFGAALAVLTLLWAVMGVGP